jgi:energy-coupling factor transporter transmembrane protein EcfT
VFVKRSTKVGIASVALLVSIFIPPYAEWRAPINLACGVLACVLGALAAGSGRRWWLVVPGSIVAGFALAIYVAVYTP